MLQNCETQNITVRHDPSNRRRTLRVGPRSIATGSQYFSLTQACQLIRFEFRPLWLELCEVRVPLNVINKYLNTFVVPNGDNPIGNITVINSTDGLNAEDAVDVLPMLRISVSSDASSGPPDRFNLNINVTSIPLNVLDILWANYRKWAHLVDAGYLTHIWIRYIKRWGMDIVFQLHDDMAEAWDGESLLLARYEAEFPEPLRVLHHMRLRDLPYYLNIRLFNPEWSEKGQLGLWDDSRFEEED